MKFLSTRAFLFTQTREADKAIADYERVVAANPRDYLVLDNLGVIYTDKKDFSKATEYFDRSLGVNDRHPEVYNGKGYIEYLKGNHEAAIGFYNKALECNSEYSDAYYNLAQSYEAQKNKAKVLDAYREFLKYAAYNDYDRVAQAQKRVEELAQE